MNFAGLLTGKTALVTGASRGIGRGIAAALSDAGARVYATGRTIADASLPDAVTRIPCDHRDDEQVARVFDRIASDAGRLDVLANAAWGGYEGMVERGTFTWINPFWEQPPWRWSAMMDAGVRAGFVASQHAARLMVPARSGVIVHLSHWAARKRLGNVIYGISKAATDAMAMQTADELRAHNITVASIYPGLVRTEAVLAAGVFDLRNSESPEFIGRAIAAMAVEPAGAAVERKGRDRSRDGARLRFHRHRRQTATAPHGGGHLARSHAAAQIRQRTAGAAGFARQCRHV